MLTSYQVTEYRVAIGEQVLFPVAFMFRPEILHALDAVATVPTCVVAGPGVNILVGLPGGLVTLYISYELSKKIKSVSSKES